ncbi:MAG: class I SAM-dependent methyltransferase [Methanobacterium sp.]
MIGLKIPKNHADEIRRILLKYSLIDLEFKIKRSKDFVFIPLIKKLNNEKIEKLNLPSFEIIETKFEAQPKQPRSLKDYLVNKISNNKIIEIKKSFDIIGDVVILEVPEELENEKYLIGKAALNFTKRRTVFKKNSKIQGIIRTRELEYLAGEDKSETIHTEYGSRLMIDVRKVYFSPRLATEREKITNQVNNGETIIDMFTGVGPFSIAIACNKKVEIYAIDINPDAIHYLEKNIILNKIQGKIIPILGDVKDVLKVKNIMADRIIMNLPETAYLFLESAINSLKEGGVLHYYEFSHDYDKPIQRVQTASSPRKVKVLDKRKVKSRSPGVWHIGLDIMII